MCAAFVQYLLLGTIGTNTRLSSLVQMDKEQRKCQYCSNFHLLVVYDFDPTPLTNKFIMMYTLLQTLTKVQLYTDYVQHYRLVLLKE